MYIPLASGFLVDPLLCRKQVEGLLDMLPTMMEEQFEGNRVAAGSAVKGALAGLVSKAPIHGPQLIASVPWAVKSLSSCRAFRHSASANSRPGMILRCTTPTKRRVSSWQRIHFGERRLKNLLRAA